MKEGLGSAPAPVAWSVAQAALPPRIVGEGKEQTSSVAQVPPVAPRTVGETIDAQFAAEGGSRAIKEKVLAGLAEGRTVSGSALAGECGVSRNAVWKAVERLRHEGYAIGGTPRRGYRLLAAPDLIRPAEITTTSGLCGRQVHYYRAIGSTNDMARNLGLGGAPEGTVVVAERQTAGRGRLGRSWWDGGGGDGNGAAPAGTDLLLSLLLRPVLSPVEAVPITLAAAVAVARAVRRSAGVSLGIKWPNDLLWGERKVAGILSEMVAEADKVAFLVLGIGVNGNTTVWPDQLAATAASLREASGKTVDRTALAKAVLEETEAAYLAFLREGPAAVRAEWLARNVTIGRRVRVRTARETVWGTAVALGEDGRLRVETPGGMREFAAGEVTHGAEAAPTGDGRAERGDPR